MRYLVLVLILVIGVSLARANDTWLVGAGGRMHRMSGEHATIRMVREWVDIAVYPEYYDVTATFVFHNDGPATTVTMGFPERGSGDIQSEQYRTQSGFQQFATWVDGKPVTARRQPAEGMELSYVAYWEKSVTFAKDQTRTVKVKYRSPAARISSGQRLVEYDFTGGNWQGTVQQSDLLVTLHTPGTWVARVGAGEHTPAMRRNANRLAFTWKEWQADDVWSIEYASTLPGWMVLPDGTVAGIPVSQPSGQLITVTQPGRVKTLDWYPPLLVRDGVLFIAVKELKRALDEQARRSGFSSQTAISWEPETKEVLLEAGQYDFAFRLGRAEMRVAGGERVKLPAAPFMGERTQFSDQELYVPMAPVVKALGGSLTLDAATHIVTMHLPAYWEERPAK